jgi:eukaryotic-like serine/threonine-protein kinase
MKLDAHLSIEDPPPVPLPIGTGNPSEEAFAPTIAVRGGVKAMAGGTIVAGASGQLASGLADTLVGGASFAARSTVLPRVELIGSEPTLVVDNKRRFEPLRSLGEGGAGYVVGVQDHDIGRQVALKRLRADVKEPSTLVRFVEEIRTIGRLEHPNIVPIHDVGVDEDGEYYFVMKYVDGETLETIIQKLAEGDPDYHRRYGFERRVEIWKSVLEAIAFAHEKGILHRDIKPANVMVGRYGEVLVMDWGIAKALQAPAAAALGATAPAAGASERPHLWKTQVGSLIGTPAYMSPEQARRAPLDERSDVYSLCLLFYELLTLRHPLADKRTLDDMLAGVIREGIPAASFVNNPYQPAVPMDLTWIIRAGVAKDPKDRYANVAAMIARLERRAEGDIPVQCHITFLMRASRVFSTFLTRHPMVATFVLSGLLLGLIALLIARFWSA